MTNIQKNLNHHINSPLFKSISKVADEMDYPVYVIGGYVRDIFINQNSKITDIDFLIIGSGIELAKNVKKNLKGASKIKIFKTYGTAMIKWESLNLEFVGARKESYSFESRNPKIISGNLKDDQDRRDFTVNTIAIQLNSASFGNLIDPFDGIKDIKNRILRTPMDPNTTYTDDPLRMLRGIRFSCQLNFNISKESEKAIKSNSKRIEIISNERIVEELNKILISDSPSKGFILLEKLGLLKFILPELISLKGIDEIEGQKHKDNFYHTLEVLENITNHSKNLWLRWAALLHDIGKATTKKFDKKIGWTFHGHELIGSKMVYKIFKRLKLPLNEKMKYVQKIVFLSSRPVILSQKKITDSAIRRIIYDAGDYIDDLITLCEADITTKNIKKFNLYHENFKIVRKKIKEVENRDRIRNFQPPISGEDIMNYFKINPCKEIGIIKEKIKEAILEGEIKNNHEQSLKMMKKIGAEMKLKKN
ncbi:MAG: CCA tRNA nucleotidyltransferase [Flavobacteriaceae bacterium]